MIRSLSERVFFSFNSRFSICDSSWLQTSWKNHFPTKCPLRSNAIDFKFFFPLCSRRALLLLRGKLSSYSVIGCFITGLKNSRQTTP